MNRRQCEEGQEGEASGGSHTPRTREGRRGLAPPSPEARGYGIFVLRCRTSSRTAQMQRAAARMVSARNQGSRARFGDSDTIRQMCATVTSPKTIAVTVRNARMIVLLDAQNGWKQS